MILKPIDKKSYGNNDTIEVRFRKKGLMLFPNIDGCGNDLFLSKKYLMRYCKNGK